MSSIRTMTLSGLLALVAATAAPAQQRPPIGPYGSPPDAMIFYVAHGPAGACGLGCSDWIAAEGTVQWDSYKRLIAILDRQAGHKLPLVIHSWGGSNLNVAVSMGRILRDHGLDATAGATEVEACAGKSETECFALKRPGGPLDAKVSMPDPACDLACVLMLAGGVHRSLPDGAKVVLTGRSIRNRRAPNVAPEQRESLTVIFGEQYRKYLLEMGVEPALVDIVDGIGEGGRPMVMAPADLARLHIVTSP
ncbi:MULTISPECIES: hypothetical protein [Bradyrhizobium]|uniref:Alpha/beta hydrolase n=1 Tax=Bradyrhizobium arachidis TaxID=858423 RepID=A0AAE7P035_9BRAD|nr:MULTISPECIES: hypothetical protein [Bradyrhizobium]QOG23155.1 hypothetical protein FOM02_43825 [Bradyrhizobium sp. SEMIA]QOZ73625.1 hypothetical protein WN72_28835 [Bradyrhizobium arachidis]UFW45987.1 hypothetical protein BaraCB756_27140 [Bradyrhizobium arachidis]SFV19372.1 hypothetical protein SAMN05192541_14948 [Bradyrhizobium arachidis]